MEMKTTKIILLRHGETDSNSRRIFQGHSDTELNRSGIMQAERAAERLSSCGIDRIYASDLRRTVHTAEIVSGGNGILEEKRLREIDFGDWEGCSFESIFADDPEKTEKWLKTPTEIEIPNGESFVEMQQRVWNVLEEMVTENREKTVLAVTHGGVIRSIVCRLLGISLDNFWKIRINNTSLTSISFLGTEGYINYINDYSHIL